MLRHYLAVNRVSWGKNIAFLHEIRGVKNTTFHTPTVDTAHSALRKFLDENSVDYFRAMQEPDWYVDVGLEIASKDKSCLG